MSAPRRSGPTEYRDGRVSLQVLSHSKTSTSRDCPAKFGYRYVDGLRPKTEKDPTRIRGRGMHAGLEAGFVSWIWCRMLGLALGLEPGDAVAAIVDAARIGVRRAHRAALAELEAARQSGAAIEVIDDVRERLEEAYEADVWAVGHFFEVVGARDYERKIPVLVENAFDVPIVDVSGRRGHLRWIGYFDCVMYDARTRTLELWEQKTVGTNAGSDEHRRRIEGDPQTTSYIYALRRELAAGGLDAAIAAVSGFVDLSATPDVQRIRAIPVGTVIVNVIRRKKPSEPKTLADGTISTDRRIDTLPELYAAALEGQREPHGLTKAEDDCQEAQAAFSAEQDPKAAEKLGKKLERAKQAVQKKRAAFQATRAKQADLLERLRQRGDTFLAEIEQFVTDHECERWRSEMWVEAERMRRIEKRPAERTRNLGYCTAPGRGCTYRTLCYSGGDESVRMQEFTTPAEREAHELEREEDRAAEREEQAGPEPYSAPAWG